MSLSDVLGDGLTRLRNAQMVGKASVSLIGSKLVAAVLDVLVEEGYIESYSCHEDSNKKFFDVKLKYYKSHPVINFIKRCSKPSRRLYVSHSKLPRCNSGMGVTILSTSKGVVADWRAHKLRVGGEVLCQVS